ALSKDLSEACRVDPSFVDELSEPMHQLEAALTNAATAQPGVNAAALALAGQVFDACGYLVNRSINQREEGRNWWLSLALPAACAVVLFGGYLFVATWVSMHATIVRLRQSVHYFRHRRRSTWSPPLLNDRRGDVAEASIEELRRRVDSLVEVVDQAARVRRKPVPEPAHTASS
ncbi:MAG: hypothetical protein ACREJC_16690, partial [Tepidisphaeraceae bacterium]